MGGPVRRVLQEEVRSTVGHGGGGVDLKGIKMADSTGLVGPVLIESGRE